MSEQPREKPAAVQQAEIEQQRVAADFAAVFGQPRTRTPSQVRVLAHLAKHASDGKNCFDFSLPRDGSAIALAAAHRDGACSILRVIDRQLQIASNVKPPKPEKPKVTR